jgi:hypothetical protein
MLVDVGNRKFRFNWKHEMYFSAAEEWLAKYSTELSDEARMSLKSVMRLMPVRRRRGKTTCFVEEVDTAPARDFKIEASAECSHLDQYRKERGRVESLEKALAQLAPMLSEYQAEHRKIRADVFEQYRARLTKKEAAQAA